MLRVQGVLSCLGHGRPGLQICPPSECYLGQTSWRMVYVMWVLKDEQEFAKPDCTKPQIPG